MQETATQITDMQALAAQRQTAKEPAWLKAQRQAAMAQFQSLGWPTPRQEAWKQTNLKKVTATTYGQASVVRPFDVANLDALLIRDQAPRLVFVNGLFSPALSNTATLPAGVQLEPLHQAVGGSLDEKSWQDLASTVDPALTALNTALFQDGVWLDVAADAVVDQPVHILHLITGDDEPLLVAPRHLVRVGRHAQVTFVEDYVGQTERSDLLVPQTELDLADGAHVTHYLRALGGAQTSLLYGYHSRQGRDTQLTSHHLLTGGGLVRGDVRVCLHGEGGDAVVNGLMLGADKQHRDVQVRVEHAKPHCTSNQLFKGIFDDHARGAFSGCIVVAQDAQKTDAVQTNRNLLLSDDARAHTKPQLEIYADDVKCAHGATTGQLDQDALYYLMARGINRQAALDLLLYAFAHEVLDHVALEQIRLQTEKILVDRFRPSL